MYSHDPLNADDVVLGSLVLTTLSYACAVLVLLGFPNKVALTIGGVFGPAFGFMAAGAAGWTCLRLRSWRCFWSFVATIPANYLWCGEVMEMVVGRV